MSDFLSRIAAEAAKPIPREVTILGQTDTVHFKLMTAAQRHALLSGQSFQVRKGDSPLITVDLGRTESEKQQLVHFCVCDDQGRQFYKSVEDVKKLPHPVLEELAKHAQSVNKDVYGTAEEGESAGES